jgi:hypothetical protein
MNDRDETTAPIPKTVGELIAQGHGGLTVQEVLLQKRMDEGRVTRTPKNLADRVKQQIKKDERP